VPSIGATKFKPVFTPKFFASLTNTLAFLGNDLFLTFFIVPVAVLYCHPEI
jgi:hypothetical protein